MATRTEQTYQERILKVAVYIQNNLDRELSLEELAQVAFFSPYHFHRIFSAYIGEPVKNYLRRLRLERALRDLTLTDLSLVRISERAGYDSQQSFQRAFKEMYGRTPKSLRSQSKKNWETWQNTTKSSKALHVDIKTIDPIKVAFVRHIGPYDNLLQTWFQLVGQVGLEYVLAEKTLKISIAHDSHEITPAEKLRYDACVTIDGLANIKPTGKVGIQTLQGGKYAVITHRGPIDMIESTYQFLFGKWLPQSGHEPADAPNFLIHRNLPHQTPVEALITEIWLPIG